MKRFISLLLTLAILTACAPATVFASSEGRCLLYVSASGSDLNDGSFDRPFATLTAARNRIRELKGSGQYPKGFTVYVREGTYNVSEGLMLTSQDSGTAEAPITYRAYEDEEVIFTGGVTAKGEDFVKVSDSAILDRVVEKSARDKIYVLDLKKYGVTDLGPVFYKGAYGYLANLVDAGFTGPKPAAPAMEFFFNGKPMTEARYPNDGYMTISGVLTSGFDYNAIDTPNERPVDECFEITVDDNRIKNWVNAVDDGALMYGFWQHAWADQAVSIAEIDPDAKSIKSAIPSAFGAKVDQPFYIYNLIEELDIPGEFYLDRKNLALYIYPTGPLDGAEITMTILDTPIFDLNDVDYVNIRGLNVIGSRNDAYKIYNGSTNCEVSDCEVSYSASYAVNIDHYTYNNGARNVYAHDVESGISVGGGNFEQLIPGNNYAENCKVERWSRITATYKSGIGIGGVGNSIMFNEMSDAPHVAVQFSGNLNKIMYNDIHNVVHSSDDAGAVYGGLNWTGRGNEIKYNYLHDIIKKNTDTSAGTSGLGGIYLDGGQCETIMVGNVFKDVSGKAIWINGGQDNIALNNIFIDCVQGILNNDIMVIVDLNQSHYPRLNNQKYAITNEVWKETFPKLQKMMELPDSEKQLPLGNIVVNNVAVNSDLINEVGGYTNRPTTDFLDYSQNVEMSGDPGFYDMAGGDYTIKADSELFDKLPGFEAVPFTRMGRVNDRVATRIQDAKILLIDSPKSFVDGDKVQIDSENKEVVPFIKNNVTYVPLRFIAEMLDANVEYDSETGMVQIVGGSVSLTVPSNGTEAVKNGEAITLSNSTMVVHGRTMVPLREISELFDKEVYWHKSGIISVSDDAALFDENGSDDELIRFLRNALYIY